MKSKRTVEVFSYIILAALGLIVGYFIGDTINNKVTSLEEAYRKDREEYSPITEKYETVKEAYYKHLEGHVEDLTNTDDTLEVDFYKVIVKASCGHLFTVKGAVRSNREEAIEFSKYHYLFGKGAVIDTVLVIR